MLSFLSAKSSQSFLFSCKAVWRVPSARVVERINGLRSPDDLPRNLPSKFRMSYHLSYFWISSQKAPRIARKNQNGLSPSSPTHRVSQFLWFPERTGKCGFSPRYSRFRSFLFFSVPSFLLCSETLFELLFLVTHRPFEAAIPVLFRQSCVDLCPANNDPDESSQNSHTIHQGFWSGKFHRHL